MMIPRRRGGLQRRLGAGLVAAGSALALCGGALAFAPGTTRHAGMASRQQQQTSALGGVALQCAPASSSFFGTTVDAGVPGGPTQSRASGWGARQAAAGGVLSLNALGGGVALKSTLRKYGLTAVVTHATQWAAWMVLGFSALAYVRALPLMCSRPRS